MGDSVRASVVAALQLIQVGDLDAARAALERALAERPRHLGANRTMALAALRANDLQSGLTYADAALQVAPFDDRALYLRASLLAGLRRPADAAAGLAAAIAAAPDDLASPWRVVARFAWDRRRRATVIAALRRLIELGVDDSATLARQLAFLEAPRRSLVEPDSDGPWPDVDAVYLWVDGTDPAWLARFRESVGFDPSESRDPATDHRRYEVCGELRFSLRCLQRHAPWLRRIFVLTDRQRPDTTGLPPELLAKLEIVDHRDVLPAAMLPTFNSSAIEAFIDRIPGLAEHFLYLNDDLVVGAPLAPGHIFTADGRTCVWVRPMDWSVDDATRLMWEQRRLDSMIGREYVSARLFEQVTGVAVPPVASVHQVSVLTRTLCASVWEAFDAVWRVRLYPRRVRGRDVPKPGLTWMWLSIVHDRALPDVWRPHELFGLQPPEFSAEHARMLLEWRPPWFCLDVPRQQRDVFAAFVEAYLSDGSASATAPSTSLPPDALSIAVAAGTNTRSR